MNPPRPESLRLVSLATPDPRARHAGKLPFGLAHRDDGAAWCVLLSARATRVALVIAELGAPPPGTLVLVLPAAARGPGLLDRLAPAPTIPLALRCTALVAQGYTGVGGGVDPASGLELAWGIAP